jgi:hypothetical protein
VPAGAEEQDAAGEATTGPYDAGEHGAGERGDGGGVPRGWRRQRVRLGCGGAVWAGDNGEEAAAPMGTPRAGGGASGWGAPGEQGAARRAGARRLGRRSARPWRRDGLGAAPGGWRLERRGKNYSGSGTMLNGKNPNPRIVLGSVLIDQITGPDPLQKTGI